MSRLSKSSQFTTDGGARAPGYYTIKNALFDFVHLHLGIIKGLYVVFNGDILLHCVIMSALMHEVALHAYICLWCGSHFMEVTPKIVNESLARGLDKWLYWLL